MSLLKVFGKLHTTAHTYMSLYEDFDCCSSGVCVYVFVCVVCLCVKEREVYFKVHNKLHICGCLFIMCVVDAYGGKERKKRMR